MEWLCNLKKKSKNLRTDQDLNIVAEGPEVVIKQSDQILDNMNEWCKKTHGETGLTEVFNYHFFLLNFESI